jgi:phospholipase/lecithinase/hemolysin
MRVQRIGEENMSRSKIDFSSLVFFGDSLTDPGNLFALTGQPLSPPYAQRFSNGPVYAEYLDDRLGVTSQNFAFGGAEATTDATDAPQQAFINLTAQVDRYLAGLGGQPAADGTAAGVFIGNNDYLRLLNPADAPQLIGSVIGTINAQVQRLLGAGVDKILLFTLPSVAVTPLGNTLTPAQLAGAEAINAANNAALASLAAGYAAAGVNVTLVDTGRFARELDADAETFGFLQSDIPIVGPSGLTGITNLFAPDEIAFMDAIHPTTAAHGATAAFVAATLEADRVQLFNAGNDTVTTLFGDDFVMTGAGDDRISVGFGEDTVLAGSGNDTVDGGFGDDVLSGGGGNDVVWGGFGDDLLAGNAGNDTLDGGFGDDVLIAGTGSDVLNGGFGDDIFYIKNEEGVADRDIIRGGFGRDTVRIEVSAELWATSAFQQEIASFVGRRGCFTDIRDGEIASLGLRLEDIERLEIFVNDTLMQAYGRGAAIGADQQRLIADAELWNFI